MRLLNKLKDILLCHNPYFNRWFSAMLIATDNVKKDSKVTILILIDGFLQYKKIKYSNTFGVIVTILILIDGFLQFTNRPNIRVSVWIVTILILIDGFLQSCKFDQEEFWKACHNPYFNRWFSAIQC